ncbi:MAG: hypothetical protein M0Z46_10250 [Actinomycetota bacterium]|nr:hypothetical protein [Actinomycetota bacterium]
MTLILPSGTETMASARFRAWTEDTDLGAPTDAYWPNVWRTVPECLARRVGEARPLTA